MLSNVLEKLYFAVGRNWILFFVISGTIYSVLGIVIGLMTGIPILSVFLIAIALIPTIDKFISLSELLEGKTKVIESRDKKLYLVELSAKAQKISIKNIFSDYSDVILAYTSFFFVIFFVFMLISFLLPNSDVIFFALKLTKAQTTQNVFFALIKNNLSVFSIAFLLSLIFEFGATFIVSWNAALWGISFGEMIKTALTQKEMLVALSYLAIAPHLILEALAYFFAAIAGALLSKAIVKEKINSDKFNRIAIQVIILILLGLSSLILAAYIETHVIAAKIL